MGQAVLSILFIIALLAGASVYFVSQQPVLSPMEFMMDQSGDDSVETLNHQRTEHLTMTTRNGLTQIRRHIDEITQGQNKFLDTIQYQQQVLANTSKEVSDIMRKVQGISGKNNNDMLRLKDLMSQMQEDQRFLVARGQDLIALNDQITQNRQWISDQIDLAEVDTQPPLSPLQQHYAALNHQASVFFHKVARHEREARDRIYKMQDQLRDLVNNAANNSIFQQQDIKDHIQRMLEEDHENMLKLADSEERNGNLLRDEREKLADSKEQLNDSRQRFQDLIDEERQKAQDQQEMQQQIQDRQNR